MSKTKVKAAVVTPQVKLSSIEQAIVETFGSLDNWVTKTSPKANKPGLPLAYGTFPINGVPVYFQVKQWSKPNTSLYVSLGKTRLELQAKLTDAGYAILGTESGGRYTAYGFNSPTQADLTKFKADLDTFTQS